MQKSRFTTRKPSIFAIASNEKFIRHLVTSFHQRSLSQSAYQNDPTKPNFGTLTATTYGNGAKVSSRYDDFNRVTGVVYGEETAPRYEYDYNAKGQVARVRDNLLNRTTQSEYDLANRPVRVKTAEAGQHVYTGQVAYDNVYGNLSEFTEKVGENRQEYGTKFGYDDENRPTSLTYSIGATTIGQSTTTIDKLNRTTFSAVKLGSKTFTSEYHFAAGGYGTGSVTNLVASITQPGCNCGYGYDDNGNIASATLNGKWTGYTYDALGQLIRVNDRSDTRAGDNGSTWVYEYDRGGNILSKKLYPYANTSGEPLQTMRFSYGNANWKDQLTAVDGIGITYDQIGNPLSDGTWQYTWENGRQLARMQSANVDARFVYNESGLRVQKIVNGVVTDYVLHGKNVVHMKRGDDELHFFYDAQNRPPVVVYNNVPYAYVKNLQGDVIAILDAEGNVVVGYTYDAWGVPIGKSGVLAETLGTLNPFRYRGYVFDEETGVYYLKSRYYQCALGRFANSNCKADMASKFAAYNLYGYCANQPIASHDPTGCDLLSFIGDCLYDTWIAPWKERADAMWENPSFYTIGNWITCGAFETVKGAIMPEKALSLQHWVDSATVALWFVPAIKGNLQAVPGRQLNHTSVSAAQIGKADVFPNPLLDVRYTNKVNEQMLKNDFHNFPSLMDDLVQTTDVVWRMGGDGELHKFISLPGEITNMSHQSIKTYEGLYEWIIDSPNICNHRFFNVHPK